jgi:DNA-binding MarR family transcriptional regulator
MDERADDIANLWVGLHQVERRALGQIEAALKAAGHPPLAWYDVLLELAKAAPAPLRQSLLEDQLLLAQYNLSRLLDRMEREGLVARKPNAGDKRATDVSITTAGKRLRRAMWPVYRDALAGALGSRLTAAETCRLRTLLEKLGAAP